MLNKKMIIYEKLKNIFIIIFNLNNLNENESISSKSAYSI